MLENRQKLNMNSTKIMEGNNMKPTEEIRKRGRVGAGSLGARKSPWRDKQI